MVDKVNPYKDMGVLYSFTCNIGEGYCMKQWAPNTTEEEKEKLKNGNYSSSDLPKWMWHHMYDDFSPHTEYFDKKRRIRQNLYKDYGYGGPSFEAMRNELNVKRKVVDDEVILAKWALFYGSIELKSSIYSKLERIKNQLDDNNLEEVDNHLQRVLESIGAGV